MAKEEPHKGCGGIIKRTGWTAVSVDGGTVIAPAWKCDKCGMKFWSWTDSDNGDESYDDELDPPFW